MTEECLKEKVVLKHKNKNFIQITWGGILQPVLMLKLLKMEYLSIGSERGLFLKRDVLLPRKETCIQTFVEDGYVLIGKNKKVFLAIF